MTDPATAIRPEGGAVRLSVRLTPRASDDRIDGFETLTNGTTVLAARVRAVPDKGEANAALERLLAEAVGVPKRDVAVVQGSTARLKTVRIAGDPEALERKIRALGGF